MAKKLIDPEDKLDTVFGDESKHSKEDIKAYEDFKKSCVIVTTPDNKKLICKPLTLKERTKLFLRKLIGWIYV